MYLKFLLMAALNKQCFPFVWFTITGKQLRNFMQLQPYNCNQTQNILKGVTKDKMFSFATSRTHTFCFFFRCYCSWMVLYLPLQPCRIDSNQTYLSNFDLAVIYEKNVFPIKRIITRKAIYRCPQLFFCVVCFNQHNR